jgi:hypothetical protein
MAAAAGIKRTTYANYESGLSNPPESVIAKYLSQGIQPPEVTKPLHPVGRILVPLPEAPAVPCSDWSDPLSVDYESFIEVDPIFALRGRFACRIIGDSMYPLLHPGDLCIWHAEPNPKLGTVIIARNGQNEATCAQLKHNGEQFVLHKLNPRYPDAESDHWASIGYLVGIIREEGSSYTTIYDPNGIRPKVF